ncbi:MAG: hypothetical protein U0610_18875 [bacterium]
MARIREAASSDGHPGPMRGPGEVRWRRSAVLSLAGAGCAALPLAILGGFILAGARPPDALPVILLPTIVYALPALPLVSIGDTLPSAFATPLAAVWCWIAWTGWIHLGRSGRLGIVPLVVVPVLVALAFAVMTPGFLGAREKARNAACDQAYRDPQDFLASELLAIRAGSVSPICGVRSTDAVISCFLARHEAATNPLNERSPLYAASAREPCQVELVARGANRVEIRQQPAPHLAIRTYSITSE